MDPVRNPYSPGAGRPPAALVGRDAEIEAWRVGLERAEAGRTAQAMVLYGLRGVGKTVLLTTFAAAARSRGWFVAQVEAGAGKPLRAAVGEALHGPLADVARPSAGRRLLKALKTAVSFKASYDPAGTWSFGIDLTESAGGGADTGVLETDLAKLARDLSDAAREEGVGVALVVDEAQDLSTDEMVALCSVAHAAGQEGWPLLLALGGLPNLPRSLARARSYAERLFVFGRVESLTPGQAVVAVREPARGEGVYWDSDAVDVVARAAAGYPYFLQQFGQESWNVAVGPTIAGPTPARAAPAAGPPSTRGSSAPGGTGRPGPSRPTCGPWRPTATRGELALSRIRCRPAGAQTGPRPGPMPTARPARRASHAPDPGSWVHRLPGTAMSIGRRPPPDGPARRGARRGGVDDEGRAEDDREPDELGPAEALAEDEDTEQHRDDGDEVGDRRADHRPGRSDDVELEHVREPGPDERRGRGCTPRGSQSRAPVPREPVGPQRRQPPRLEHRPGRGGSAP